MDTEYLKRALINAVIIVLSVALMIYAGYHIVKSFSDDVETIIATVDDFDEAINADAYILRQEKVLYSNTGGVVNYLVGDGEKVAAGTEVADVYKSGSGNVRERIEAIDVMIESLERVENSAKYLSLSDIGKIDTAINEVIYSVSRKTAENDFSSVAALSEEQLFWMNLRQIMTGEADSFEEKLATLKAERAAAVAELTDVADTVKTDVSAYYFYEVDGYETAFAFDDVDSLSYSDVAQMMSSQPQSLSGKEAGKLVSDYIWYVALPIDQGTAEYFTVGESYVINFSASGSELSMKLEKVLSDSDRTTGNACLIFSSDFVLTDFDYTRMQPVSINVREYEGYKLPLSAVRVVDYDGVPVEGVYVLYGNTVRFRRIEIILSQDGYVLCASAESLAEADDGIYQFPLVGETEAPETEPAETELYETVPFLELFDLVIVSAKELYDGKIIVN